MYPLHHNLGYRQTLLSNNIARDLTHPLVLSHQGACPPVLSHRDVLLNRSLSHWFHRRIIWSTISSLTQLSPQGRRPHIIKTQSKVWCTLITWAPSPHTGVHTHLMGILTPHRGTHRLISVQRGTTHPSHGLSHKSTQLSLRGERVLEDVSRRCNHQQ